MTVLRFVLGDQLSRELASLGDIDKSRDVVFMCEVAAEATHVRHHKKKIAFLFSAMRHFARELEAAGCRVDYVKLDDPENAGSFRGELDRAVKRHGAKRVVVTEPGEWRVLQDMRGWEAALGLPVWIREDDRFLCSRREFRRWADGRHQLRMEFFYREMRRKTGFLMQDGAPIGPKWNYDAENRKRLPSSELPPQRIGFAPDAITREVLELVAARFGDHFGDLEPFAFAVTRAQALETLDRFVKDCLPSFGDYQDAMRQGEPFLYHSVLSPYVNAGLLSPREICERAIAAYENDEAPLNAVEGFVRQIIGWREYVRGIYWLRMPDYAATNALGATRDLPWFYWSGETEMNCLHQVISETRANAYAHHIQRLMVTGMFALLAGIEPAQVEEWYLIVYADAYDWVELPNVHGMILFADGGYLASKPYAASGAYIDRMSDYCRHCRYVVKLKEGEDACPFNYLYWNFLIENREVLKGNQRMKQIYAALDRMSEARARQVRADADQFLAKL